MRTIIGTYDLAEPTTFRTHYETASWYTDVLVPAGRYALVADVQDGTVVDHSIHVEGLHGTVVASLFINRIGAHSLARKNEDVGKPRLAAGPRPYAHDLARKLLVGEAPNFILDGYEPRVVHFMTGGKLVVTHQIVSKRA